MNKPTLLKDLKDLISPYDTMERDNTTTCRIPLEMLITSHPLISKIVTSSLWKILRGTIKADPITFAPVMEYSTPNSHQREIISFIRSLTVDNINTKISELQLKGLL